MSTSAVTLYRTLDVSTRRTHLEIDQDLNPILEKIQTQVNERLRWKNVPLPVARNLIKPSTLPKLVFCMGVGYIEYLLVRGTFAGIEVDMDSNFTHLFSSNRETRLATGLDLTNGDQAGQFIFDGVTLGCLTFHLVFREPYYKFAAEAINASYQPFLAELLEQMNTIKIQISSAPDDQQLLQKLVTCQENVDRLYKQLKSDLKPYNGAPQIPMRSLEVKVE